MVLGGQSGSFAQIGFAHLLVDQQLPQSVIRNGHIGNLLTISQVYREIISHCGRFFKMLSQDRAISCVSVSNIGYIKPKERSQGKGGDLRSKYDLTLTVVRKQYNGRGLFGKACRTALDTLSCCAPVPAGFTT